MQDLDRTIASGDTIKMEISKGRPHLIVLYPQNQFKQIPLSVGTAIIGRGADADIRLDDELVSRRHCSITFDGVDITLRDLGSTNGTFVNGAQLMPLTNFVMEDSHRLQIGKMILKVDFKDPTEEAFDRELYEAATLDPLTKINNRRTFMERSLGELSLAKRNNLFVHTLMVDVDHFKKVNDTFGHQCGDKVLKEVARILKEEKRESDLLARYGGEEFVVLLSGISPEDACKSAERFRVSIERHRFSWKDSIVPVTISLGLCSKQGAKLSNVEDMIAESDRLLYLAKERGRNQVAF